MSEHLSSRTAGASTDAPAFTENSTRKVFGLGLSKTGTSSLGAALNRLGIRTVHYPHDVQTLAALQEGQFRLPLLGRYQGIVDITVAPFYKELDEAWPGSRFILTVRDKAGWLRSVERHWQLMHEWARRSSQFDRFTRFIVERVYGTWEFDAAVLEEAYDRHEADVRRYFRDRDDLLVLDVCAGEGWETLCPFLGCDVPDIPFPHSNRTRSKEAGAGWIRRLENVRSGLRSVIPAGERIVLIEDGELAGCGFEEDFATSPLIEREGVDWGAPADGGEAIAALERHRQAGTRYLAVAWPAFWWLDVYREFNDYVRSRFDCLHEDSVVVVFDLEGEEDDFGQERLIE